MNDRYLAVITCLIVIIIAGASIFYSWKLYDENHIDVSGTVIAKAQTTNSQDYGRRVRTEWYLAVRPIDVKL